MDELNTIKIKTIEKINEIGFINDESMRRTIEKSFLKFFKGIKNGNSRYKRLEKATEESGRSVRTINELIECIMEFLVKENITNTKVIHSKNTEIFPSIIPKVRKNGFSMKEEQKNSTLN